ncbi:MAG: hypothetical protein ABSD20_15620 [Terriglobales bacterium]|jgi:hypothetical protein
MVTKVEDPSAISAEWSNARLIRSFYLKIVQRFSLVPPPCPELDAAAAPDAFAMVAVRQWMRDMDDMIQVHQLRQFLQTTTHSNEFILRVLIQHHLRKKVRSAGDRDKLDYLLVQYFFQCGAPEVLQDKPTFAEVGAVLKPVLGEVAVAPPSGLEALEVALWRINQCATMGELLRQGLLYEAQKIKKRMDQGSFGAAELTAFARFNFLVRQAFFRLMHADISAIRQGANRLQEFGVTTIMVNQAGSSGTARQMPLVQVLKQVQQWKESFQSEYSAGNPFLALAELRMAVDAAAAQHERPREDFRMVAPEPEAVVSNASGDENESAPEIPDEAPAPSTSAEPAQAAASGVDSETANEVVETVSRLTAYLTKRPQSTASGVTLAVGNAKLTLTSTEVTAFLEPNIEFSWTIRENVALRLLLLQTLDQARRTGSRRKLMDLISLSRNRMACLHQDRTAVRAAGNARAFETLTAAARRLATILHEADQFGKRRS